MADTVCAVIPSIPPRRNDMLPLALRSVLQQTYPVTQISVAADITHDGAWATRQRALDAASTDWIAFLDDDDEWYPEHIEHLLRHALESDADYAFSYYDTTRTHDYLGHFGKTFDPTRPHHTTMTVLVRTKLAQAVRFTPRDPHDVNGGEDWRFTLGCVELGARIVHLPEMTWLWRHHGSNTSGREDRW